MIKKLFSLACAISLSAGSLFAGAGMYDSFAIVNGTFYDVGATTMNPDFEGALLGTFDPSTDSIFLGGQQKSFKNNGTDVTGHFIDYRIFQGAPSGSFTPISFSFQWNSGDPGAPGGLGNAGDQQWGTDEQGANIGDDAVNILTSLAPGTYTLQVYTRITTNGVDADPTIFNNVGGSNYTATFNVVPEPSSVALLAGPAILGALMFFRRRRA